MDMELVIPSTLASLRILLSGPGSHIADEFYRFCEANPEQRFERTSEGEIILVAPAGAESDHRNAEIIYHLQAWAKKKRQGKVFGPSAAFILPSGAIRSPDAAWISQAKLDPIRREQKRRFLQVTPEFVVEVMSPRDRLPQVHRKMAEWIAAGVELAWLIDADKETVHIHRPGRTVEKRTGLTMLAGEGPVAGFRLPLRDVWAPL
jgi:Uma2 family endonuclease